MAAKKNSLRLTPTGLVLVPLAVACVITGVAVLAVELIVARRGRDRRVGLALATGLALKLLLEQAWVRPVSVGGAWPFPVATFAHLTGVAAGAACAALAIPWAARSCTDEATLRGGPTPSERRQP